MNRKLNSIKNILRRRWMAVLIAVAVVLFIFLMLFTSFEKITIQALSQLNGEFVKQVDTISATSLDMIWNSAMQIYYSSSVRILRTSKEMTNAQRTLGLRDLGNFVSSCTFLTNAMIYNPTMDYIFTSDSDHPSAPVDKFYDSTAASLLTNADTRSFSVSEKKVGRNGEYYSFVFYEANEPSSGVLLLNVRAKWYESQLLGISSGDSCAILDASGKALAVGSHEVGQAAEEIWPTIIETCEEDTPGFILDQRTAQGWMYCKLKNSGWLYLRSFNANTIVPSLTKMQNIVFIILTAVCGVLILGAAYTFINLYTPFNAVRQALINAGETAGEVSQQVDDLLERQREQRLLRQFKLILEGKAQTAVPYPISLILTDCAQVQEIRDKIGQSMEQLAVNSDFGSAILLFGASEEETKQLCEEMVQAFSCHCFYGAPRTNAQELVQCRENLNELWQMRFLYVGRDVLPESTLNNHNVPGFQSKDCAALLAALRNGQLEEARLCWQNIFSIIQRCRFADLRFSVRYLIKSLNNLYKEFSTEPLNLSPDIIDTIENVNQVTAAMDAAFVRIVDAEEKERMKRLDQMAQQIIEYIEMQYADNLLSVQEIADKMGMNAVYLGRLFKKSTGISISEAINRQRVENAKRLLRETKDSIEEIARQVGFDNVKYFFVVFKNIVNSTPKKYRDDIKEQLV
ncbi:MAG: helix-turn-helix domain-containing protein [Oscillospiraceae bacterium]|nr:helix-turn-helix domain-containing protein [Oscillospiraceae bacterium]